mmetsp:Transcript_3976/g.8014  ORF Transcript_3976/g.8014 Transcript_3976/m.8014 type:complete len:212 (-) Transcript_3976:62-697(-)
MSQPLETLYPVTTPCTITYPPTYNLPPCVGTVFCTDEISNTVTCKIALDYTTTSVKMITLHISKIQTLHSPPTTPVSSITLSLTLPDPPLTTVDLCDTFPPSLRKVDLKKLQEREAYQCGLADDALMHRNDDVGELGQKVFSLLLKACNEVRWTDKTGQGKKKKGGKKVNIEVMKDILVKEPYGKADVEWIGKGEESGMDRIVMIVQRAQK